MRRPHLPVLVAVVVAVVAGATAAGSPAAVPGVPSIYVDYNPDCTFTLTVDPGTVITSSTAPGPTLPPGNYQLLTSLPNPSSGYPCAKPTFTLTGAGVSIQIVFTGVELHDERLLTLQASSTYIAEDENAPAQTRKFFTTAASGSSSSLLGSATATTSSASRGADQGDIVGSALMPYRGELVGAVSAAGKATLKQSGRSVGSLKAGKYDIKVDDAAPRAGFFVERSGRKAVTVTTRAFAGVRTQRVALTAGTWTFFSDVGKPTRFTVVASSSQ